MNKIICLVGESGSGKSTIGELLEKEGYRYISSFTTRKPRFEGECGHIFTTMKQYECNRATGMIVAETFFDGEYYWTTKGQFYGECVYVVDPRGVKDLKQKMKDTEIIVIYLKASRICRIARMLEREGYGLCEPTPKDIYYPIKERANHDYKAFLEFKLEKQYDYCVDAEQEICEVLQDVEDIIKRA